MRNVPHLKISHQTFYSQVSSNIYLAKPKIHEETYAQHNYDIWIILIALGLYAQRFYPIFVSTTNVFYILYFMRLLQPNFVVGIRLFLIFFRIICDIIIFRKYKNE